MVTPSVAAAIALLSLLFWSEAFAQAKTYWYCQFTPFGQHNVMYLSDVFGPTENAMSVGGSTQQKILAAFDDYVAGKYSESGSAGCAYFDSASHANDDKKQNEDLIVKNSGRFIERVGGIRALLELLSRTRDASSLFGAVPTT